MNQERQHQFLDLPTGGMVMALFISVQVMRSSTLKSLKNRPHRVMKGNSVEDQYNQTLG
jgi:hypothetical protein